MCNSCWVRVYYLLPPEHRLWCSSIVYWEVLFLDNVLGYVISIRHVLSPCLIFLCFCLHLSMCSYNLFKKLIIESNQLILGASGYWEDSDHTWDSEYYFTCNTNESTVKVSIRSLYISPFFYDYYFWLLLLFCLEQRCYLKSISSRGEILMQFSLLQSMP